MSLLATCLSATQRVVPHGVPAALVSGRVIENVFPDGFDRVPGCVGAAVYEVSERCGPRSTERRPVRYLVAVYRFPGKRDPEWTTARLPEAVTVEPPTP